MKKRVHVRCALGMVAILELNMVYMGAFEEE